MTRKKQTLPTNCYTLRQWAAGHDIHGGRIVVGVSDTKHWLSSRRAQRLADEIIFQLCYQDDLGCPEEEVFI